MEKERIIKLRGYTPWIIGIFTLVFCVFFLIGLMPMRSCFLLCCSSLLLLLVAGTQICLYTCENYNSLQSWFHTICILIFVIAQCFVVFSRFEPKSIYLLLTTAYLSIMCFITYFSNNEEHIKSIGYIYACYIISAIALYVLSALS